MVLKQGSSSLDFFFWTDERNRERDAVRNEFLEIERKSGGN
jgi:hypothetical protein